MKKKTTKKVIKKKVRVKKMTEVKKVEAKAKGYTIRNLGNTPAKELKPGIGTFEIPVGGTITVDSKEIADSLVNDSGGKLALEE